MQIIAHRGFWKKIEERNTSPVFQNCVDRQLGTETDFRDYCGELVISHDIATQDSMRAEEFFRMYSGLDVTLALNIKADGIQKKLKELLEKYQVENYFCFDMAIPDTLGYISEDLKFFTRESEYEPIPAFLDKAEGVWLDGFIDDGWIDEAKIGGYLEQGKRVCIVSPDLHGRPYEKQWQRYAAMKIMSSNDIILCTDYPEEARDFFAERGVYKNA